MNPAEDEFGAVRTSELDLGPAEQIHAEAGPEVNYLARDYAGYRQLMINRLALLLPSQIDLNPAGLGMAIVEALAYSADQLSYYQDAVATEAYLGTARRRISVRRHARLVDYAMHEGCNARVWVQLQLDAEAESATIERKTVLLTGQRGGAATVAPGTAALREMMAAGAEVFETLHEATLVGAHNEIFFHTTAARPSRLIRGATSAVLCDRWVDPQSLTDRQESIRRLTISPAGLPIRGVDPTDLLDSRPDDWESPHSLSPPQVPSKAITFGSNGGLANQPANLFSYAGASSLAFAQELVGPENRIIGEIASSTRMLAAGYETSDGSVKLKVWHRTDPNISTEFEVPPKLTPTRIVLSSDGSQLAAWLATPNGPRSLLYLWRATDPTNPEELWRGYSGTETIVFSPDGLMLAAGYVTPDGEKSVIRLFEIDAQANSEDLQGPPGLMDVAFSPDSSMLAAGYVRPGWGESEISLWQTSDPTDQTVFKGFGGLTTLVFSPDGSQIAANYEGRDDHMGGLCVWQTHDPTSRIELEDLPGLALTNISFSPDGLQIAAGMQWLGEGESLLLIWQISESTDPISLDGPPGLMDIVFSSDGTKVAASFVLPGDQEELILVWRLSDAGDPVPLEGPPGMRLTTFAFSPDGSQLAAGYILPGDQEELIRLWRLSDPADPASLYGPSGLTTMVFSPDGSQLAAGYAPLGGEGSVILRWQMSDPTNLTMGFEGPPDMGLAAIAFSSDGMQMAAGFSASDGQTSALYLWQTLDQATPTEYIGRLGMTLRSIIVSPDASQLIADSVHPEGHSELLLWQRSDPDNTTRLRAPQGQMLSAVAFSIDNAQMAALFDSSDEGTSELLYLRTSDPDNQTSFATLPEPALKTVAFSPDGTQLAAEYELDEDQTNVLLLWQMSDPANPAGFEYPSGPAWKAIVFSTDGSQLAAIAGSSDEPTNTLHIWQTLDPYHPVVFNELPSSIRSLGILSKSGVLVVSTLRDTMKEKVQVWDLADSHRIRELDGDVLAWSLDERHLVTKLDDSSVQRWRLGERALHLQTGDVLILEDGEDPTHRHPVRLTKISPTVDHPADRLAEDDPPAIVEIEWAQTDALPFDLPFAAGNASDLSVARGNIVLADHGRSIDGVALPRVEPRGRFRPVLPHTDLTHGEPYEHEHALTESAAQTIVQNPRAAVPALRLIADGQTWKPLRDLLESSPQAHHFVAELENDRRAHLRFGDDDHGCRPATGTKFTANYAIGNGTQGNVGAEAIAHVVTADTRITRVCNPLAAVGGVDPESIEHVRLVAPQAYKSQLRCVTAADYAQMATRHPSVRHATAEMRWTGSWTTVYLYVEQEENGQPIGMQPADQFADLSAFLEPYRQIGVDVAIRAPQPAPVEIGLRIFCKPGFLHSLVQRALLDRLGNDRMADGRPAFFHVGQFSMGQPLYSSPIITAAMAVSGVERVELTHFGRLGRSDSDTRQSGQITVGPHERIRLDNDPEAPQFGRLTLVMEDAI